MSERFRWIRARSAGSAGTGRGARVGAGIIANGGALRGRDGHAGEIGHTVMDASGPVCRCGKSKNGCLEVFEAVELRAPAFGADSALIGAAEIAFAEVLDDPVTARALVTA